MKFIDLKVGWECNHNCIHCVVHSKRNFCEKKSFSFDELKVIIDNNKDSKKFTITGGEPFLRSDIIDILHYIKNKTNCFIEVQTNGTFLKDESLVKEAKKYVDNFFVSLHSYKKSTHDLICQKNGSWDDTITGFANLINNNCDISTQTVISKLNVPDLIKTFDFFSDIKLYNNWLTFPHPNGNAETYAALVVPKYSEIKDIIWKILDNHKNVNLSGFPACYLPYENLREKELNLYKKNNNKLYCFELVNDKNKNYAPDSDFDSQILKEFNKNEICSTCIYNDRCIGVWKEYFLIHEECDLNPIKKC